MNGRFKRTFSSPLQGSTFLPRGSGSPQVERTRFGGVNQMDFFSTLNEATSPLSKSNTLTPQMRIGGCNIYTYRSFDDSILLLCGDSIAVRSSDGTIRRYSFQNLCASLKTLRD